MNEEKYQLLFRDGDVFTFMNSSTFEQIQVSKDVIGEPARFLQDDMIVTITSYEGEIIGVMLPDTVVMEIVEAEAVVKGQTASASYKPAILENGVRILVPPHIDAGTKVVVNTNDGTYVEKAK